MNIIYALAVSLFGFSVARAEILSPGASRVSLIDFSVDATDTLLRKSIACSAAEVRSGLVEIAGIFDTAGNDGRDPRVRKLRPTFYPVGRDAAWYISNAECKSLAPYLNGIGFSSFNAESGNAVIYLASFYKKPVEAEDPEALINDVGLHDAPAAPDAVKNIFKFSAKCERVYTGFLNQFTRIDAELICLLEHSRGRLRLAVH